MLSKIDITELRSKMRITQEELAALIGVSLRTVQNYESGSVIPKTKHEILRRLINNGLTGLEEITSNYSPSMTDLDDAFNKMLCKMFQNEEIFPASVVRKKNEEINKLHEEIGGLKAKIEELRRDLDQKRASSA